MKNTYLNKTDQFSFMLKPSKVEGVGVYATHSIKKGTRLRIFPGGESKFVSNKSKWFKSPLRKLFLERYSVEVEGGIYCPPDFSRMDIGWYLNHSKKPNTLHDEKYNYYAKKNIEKDEEIFINYRNLSDVEKNSEAWK